MPVLRVIDGPSRGVAIQLAAQAVTIGRDQSASLPLNDPKSSRIHAEIAPGKDGRWTLTDLESSNGTWGPNGRLRSIVLVDGFSFRIGQTYLRFEVGEDTIGERPRPWTDPKQVRGLDEDDGASLLRPPAHAPSRSGVEAANAYLALLHRIVLQTNAAQGRDALFEVLDDAAAEVLEGDRCAVFLPAGDGPEGGWTLWPAHERRLRARYGAVPFARTLLADVRRRPLPLLCTTQGDLDPSVSMVQAGVSSAMAAPVRVGGQVHALLYVDRLGLTPPFTRTELEFLAAVANQLAVRLSEGEKVAGLEAEVRRLSAAPARPQALEIVAGDPAMQAVMQFAAKAAPTAAPVLIHGESGTGKELIARAVHQGSPRAGRPLQVMACAGLPEAQADAMLFGIAAGDAPRPGLCELADTATLLLDEVAELAPAIQAKLARLIEHGEMQRIGDAALRRVDVRILATTSRDLAEEVRQGRFREDLRQRLAAFAVAVPPLRERRGDIDALAEHFLRLTAEKLGQPLKRLAPEARAALMHHEWPGNVRQLRTAIERACVLAADESIEVRDLAEPTAAYRAPGGGAGHGGGFTPIVSLAEVERQHILRILDHCGGNKKAAAELLQIDRSTLYAKLRLYGRS